MSRLKDPVDNIFLFLFGHVGNFVTDMVSQLNFGQGDPDGENNFTDSNGRGGFRFEPPQGFVWCTQT